LGARLKNLSQNWQQKISENTEFETHPIYYKDEQQNSKEKDILKLKDFDYQNDKGKKTNKKTENAHPERLIISHSLARAAKDKKDREKALEKLISKLKKSTKPTDLM
jgi:hypothetical protein